MDHTVLSKGSGLVAQDVGHAGGGTTVPPAASTSWRAPASLAGFQVSTTGRFWVSTEAQLLAPLGSDRSGLARIA